MEATTTEKANAADGDSIEEILHSIRDIIAKDADDTKDKAPEAKKDEASAPAQEAAPDNPETPTETESSEEVLELTEVVAEGDSAKQAGGEAEGGTDVLQDIDAALNDSGESAEESATEPEPAVTENNEKPAMDSLVSEASAKATSDALKELMKNVPKTSVDSPSLRSGTTLENLVVEAIKPFLTEWLDKNLPTIVENIVQKEIKKLVPRD